MNPTLKQKMDELAKKYESETFRMEPWIEPSYEDSFKEGFSYCHYMLSAPIADVESRINEEANEHECNHFGNPSSFKEGAHFYHSEILPSLLAKERESAIRECVDKLMTDAGNYCACQQAPDYLMCSKHAMTYSSEILEREMIGENK
jgi:hypothetical protein